MGSYDIMIGMNWLEKHWSLINCNDKTIIYLNEGDIRQEVQGMKIPLKLRPIKTS